MAVKKAIVYAILAVLVLASPTWAWWDSSWVYRVPVTINNTGNSNTLTDYQVLVTLDTATLIADGKMNSDCSDLRVVDEDDTTGLSFWIEDGTCNTAETHVWVKVPLIPASDTKTIYFYYGNPEATTSTSSIDDTFIFGDDFNDGTLDTSKWSLAGGTTVTFSDGKVTIQVDSTIEGWSREGIINPDLDLYTVMPVEIVSRGSAQETTTESDPLSIHNTINVATESYTTIACWQWWYNPGDYHVRHKTGSTSYANSYPDDSYYLVDDGFHDFGVIIKTRTDYVFYYDSIQNSLEKNDVYSESNAYLLLGSGYQNDKVTIDYVYVKKYTYPEPSTTTGTEETAPRVTISEPQNQTYYTYNGTESGPTIITINTTYDYSGTESYYCEVWHDSTLLDNSTSPTGYQANISPVTAGSHNLTVYCKTDTGRETSTSVVYTMWAGLIVTVDQAPYRINATNGTSTYTDANLYGTTNVYWSKLPTGTINVTIQEENDTIYYYPYTFQTVNNQTWITNKTVTLEPKPENPIQLVSSAGWTIIEGTTTTIECLAAEDTPSMSINNVTVSNPYTFTPSQGLYDVYCDIRETETYAPASTTKTLVVNRPTSCTDNETFAYEFNDTVNGRIGYNMTSLVEAKIVKPDLSDVWVIGANQTFKNGTILVVETDSERQVAIRFGNYYATTVLKDVEDIHPTPEPPTETRTITTYTQINPLIEIQLLNEFNSTLFYPPNTTSVHAVITCSLGDTFVPVNEGDTRILVASKQPVTRALARVSYTADAYYSRQVYTDRAYSELAKLYVADAYSNALDLVTFRAADTSLYDALLQVYKERGGTEIIITEGYLDSSHEFATFLAEDTEYQIRAVEPDGTIIDLGTILVTQPTIKEVGTPTLDLTTDASLITENIQTSARIEGTTLYIAYQDATNQTINATVTVKTPNGTTIYSHTITTSTASLSTDITGHENETLTITWQVHHETFGNSPVTKTLVLWSPQGYGLGASTELVAGMMVVLLAIVFGIATRRTLVPTSLAGMGLILVLKAVGWLPISYGGITVIGVMLAVVIITSMRIEG